MFLLGEGMMLWELRIWAFLQGLCLRQCRSRGRHRQNHPEFLRVPAVAFG